MGNSKIEVTRHLLIKGNYKMSKHALERSDKRNIFLDQIKRVILEGEIVEEYKEAKPYPAFLVMKQIDDFRKPLYVCFALRNKKMLYIITVHWFDPEKWIDPWTRRKEDNNG